MSRYKFKKRENYLADRQVRLGRTGKSDLQPVGQADNGSTAGAGTLQHTDMIRTGSGDHRDFAIPNLDLIAPPLSGGDGKDLIPEKRYRLDQDPLAVDLGGIRGSCIPQKEKSLKKADQGSGGNQKHPVPCFHDLPPPFCLCRRNSGFPEISLSV